MPLWGRRCAQMFSLSEASRLTFSGTGYDGNSGQVLLEGQPIQAASHPAIAHILEIGFVCNNTNVNSGKVVGQPTEAALIAAAQKMGLHGARDNHVRTLEVRLVAVRWCRAHCACSVESLKYPRVLRVVRSCVRACDSILVAGCFWVCVRCPRPHNGECCVLIVLPCADPLLQRREVDGGAMQSIANPPWSSSGGLHVPP